jgi:hypothetical protein
MWTSCISETLGNCEREFEYQLETPPQYGVFQKELSNAIISVTVW